MRVSRVWKSTTPHVVGSHHYEAISYLYCLYKLLIGKSQHALSNNIELDLGCTTLDAVSLGA